MESYTEEVTELIALLNESRQQLEYQVLELAKALEARTSAISFLEDQQMSIAKLEVSSQQIAAAQAASALLGLEAFRELVKEEVVSVVTPEKEEPNEPSVEHLPPLSPTGGEGKPLPTYGISAKSIPVLRNVFGTTEKPIPTTLEGMMARGFGDNWQDSKVPDVMHASLNQGPLLLGVDLARGAGSVMLNILRHADESLNHYRIGTAPKPKKGQVPVPHGAVKNLAAAIEQNAGWDVYDTTMRNLGIRKEN